MSTRWRGALQRVMTTLARRHQSADGGDPELGDEAGFTLIELMVVLVIMGILMAIAIPTFLGVTSTANDTSTQSNLTNIITSAKAIYAQGDTYPKTLTMANKLTADEPEFKYLAAGVALTESQHQDTIAVVTGTTTGTAFIAAAYMTKTKECWVAKDEANGAKAGVFYAYVKGAGTALTVTAATCTVAKAAAIPTGTWSSKWPPAPTGH